MTAARTVALPPGHAWTVTLVTGDVVGVRTVRGRPPLVTIQPGPGRQGVIFSTYVDTRGHIEVLPRDVAPLVGKVLDPALFDVTTLIRDGDDNARRFGRDRRCPASTPSLCANRRRARRRKGARWGPPA
jgi:hypothetical protein